MFQTFRNAWKIPELKNRLLFTLAILVVYRLGCAIPVPFVSGSALTQMFANGDMLSYLNMMSGGALARCTLFALGVTPYINASIIVQLLTVAIPALENLAKEADGQQKLQQINLRPHSNYQYITDNIRTGSGFCIIQQFFRIVPPGVAEQRQQRSHPRGNLVFFV